MGMFDGKKKAKRKEARRSAKLERKQMRQDARTERASGRQGVRSDAYAAGINPNSFISDSIGSVANAAGDVFSAKFNALGGALGGAKGGAGGDQSKSAAGGENTMPLVLGAAALGYFLMKK